MPTFDELNVSLSRTINDSVSAASSDGIRYTSARRVDILNQAIRRWVMVTVKSGDYTPLSGYITEKSKALTANAVSLADSTFSPGIAFVIGIINTTSTPDVLIREIPDGMRYLVDDTTSANGFYKATTTQQWYHIDDASITIFGSGATDTIKVHYVTRHADLSVGGTILVPTEYHHQILDLATALALEDAPTAQNVARSEVKKQEIGKEIGGRS